MAGGGDALAKALKDKIRQAESIKGKKLEVGFFAGATYPDGTKVAEVAYWNEFGIPQNNQPPRPFFRTAIAENKEQWIAQVKSWLADGKSLDAIFEALGINISADIKQSIVDLKEPPLSHSTIMAKRRKGINNPGDPLIETARMYKSVTYEVTDD